MSDREYVVMHLHYEGERWGALSASDQTEARYLADGYGDLSGCDLEGEGLDEMLYDWSHVRDSSPRAIARMATFIRSRAARSAPSAAQSIR